MHYPRNHSEWEIFRKKELDALLPILAELGFNIDAEQKHMGGERYLMQAVTTTSGYKLILIGTRKSDNKRVIIKATREQAGMRELQKESVIKDVLHKIHFAYDAFFSPPELVFTKKGNFLIQVQEFIDQEKTFLERSLPEQFSFALKAFKSQESAHAATLNHIQLIEKIFGNQNAEEYISLFKGFKKNISSLLSKNREILETLDRAEKILLQNKDAIEQYSGFLTHTDFVPHNIRIKENKIYLLDHSSIRFGNKYEGWARFLNFMTLYNPPLEKLLVEYVRENRTPEESLSLKLMRIYRLGEIIWYYTQTLEKSSGDLLLLNQKRIDLWAKVLRGIIDDSPITEEEIEKYKKDRDSLRSEEEKKRQVGLH